MANPGSPGANQTWNLSSMSGTSGGITYLVSPSSTPNGSSYPSANVAWNNMTNGVNYLETSSSTLKFYGVATSTTVVPYSDPEDFLHFPFTYNNSFVDPFAGTYVSSGYTWYRQGTTTVTADSYGTLITPTGTYGNVLRVHFVEAYQDSANFGVPYIITTNSDQYRWYQNGIHVEVAQTFTLTTSAGGTYYGSAYVTGSVGLETVSGLIGSSEIFPDPASTAASVTFTLSESKNARVEVYNTLGQNMNMITAINGVQGSNTVELNISSLSDGIYFVKVLLEGQVAEIKRIVVSK